MKSWANKAAANVVGWAHSIHPRPLGFTTSQFPLDSAFLVTAKKRIKN